MSFLVMHIPARKIIILGLFLVNLTCMASEEVPVFRIAIMQSEEHLFHKEILDNLLEGVKKALPSSTKIDVFEGTPEQIKHRVKEHKTELIFCNSILYRSLLPYGVKDLVTLQSAWNPNPNRAEGAVAVVKREGTVDSFNKLLEIQKPVFEFHTSRKMDVLYYILGEVESQHLDSERFLRFTQETHATNSEIINRVENGAITAGLLPACFLEKYAVQHPSVYKRIKVINQLRSSELPCSVSTTLYPNWSVLITPSTKIKQATDIALQLLLQPRNIDASWWSVSTQFKNVDTLLKDLRVEQYAYLREWTVRKVIEQYFPLFILAGALLIGGVLYVLFANRLIKVRTKQLSQSLSRQSKYRKEYEMLKKDNAIYERMGVVTQISSIITHELRQPLNSISCFARGLLMQLESKEVPQETIANVVFEIDKKTQKADEIIRKVRNFSRYGRSPSVLELNQAVRNSIDSYLLSSNGSELIHFEASSKVFIYIDPFELELLVLNLLRNSSEALVNRANARISVWLQSSAQPGFVKLIFEDNGNSVSENTIEKLKHGLETSKNEGTGIGSKIVSEIVYHAHGYLNYKALKKGGLSVTIQFPTVSPNEN